MARSNLIDEATITSPTGNLAVNGLTIAAVPLTVVTIPTTGRSVLLRGGGPLRHSVASVNVALIIALVGSAIGEQADTAYGMLGTAGTLTTPNPEVLLPPFSPGDYQLFVGSATAGNIVVDASDLQPGWLRALYA